MNVEMIPRIDSCQGKSEEIRRDGQ